MGETQPVGMHAALRKRSARSKPLTHALATAPCTSCPAPVANSWQVTISSAE